jgi:hypothetical protein
MNIGRDNNMCQVHYVFHKILSELGKNYHGENGQPFMNEDQLLKKMNSLIKFTNN